MNPYSMHPSEMKNRAIIAAAEAKRDGFTGTTAALLLLAQTYVSEAKELETLYSDAYRPTPHCSTATRFHILNVIH